MPSTVIEPVGSFAANKTILDLLARSGALLEGHFLLSSGLHSPRYVQCAKLLESPGRAEIAGRLVADLAREWAVDTVVGPALGGVIIAHEVARALNTRCLFTERVAGEMALRRGFELRSGERVLIVEDVITTGKSSLEVRDVLAAQGADVIGYACILNRSGQAELGGSPLLGLVDLELPTWWPEACPLCATGDAAVKPGSRPRGPEESQIAERQRPASPVPPRRPKHDDDPNLGGPSL
ncbi:MAG: orotate phosphoribosyltransferase [Candidatus Sericytochromatia bacterium]|uniref:Orotate phosphoribosyltransferase n=1 Tax=Candidatus Tanganyikabacteria bacterium TaxID=2961651 RepID=A0A937X6D2_9BACT|nr:orotate phosphoribosyltransferase [Candidatus Tanganyikabacteria bacterium]